MQREAHWRLAEIGRQIAYYYWIRQLASGKISKEEFIQKTDRNEES